MSVRLFACFLAVMAGGLLYLAIGINSPLSYDPLGSRPFPLAIIILLLVLSVIQIFKSSKAKTVIQNKRVITETIAILAFYLITFEFLGFMLSTTVAGYLITRVSGANRMQALLTGLIVALSYYGIFRFQLDAPLPLGSIFRVLI